MRKRVHGRNPPAPRESRRCSRLARRGGSREKSPPVPRSRIPALAGMRVGARLPRGGYGGALEECPHQPQGFLCLRRSRTVPGAKSPVPQPCPCPTPRGWPWRQRPARAASLRGWELLPELGANAAGPSAGDGGGCGCRRGIASPRQSRRDGYSLAAIERGWVSSLVPGSLSGAVSDGGAGGEAASSHGSQRPALGTQTLLEHAWAGCKPGGFGGLGGRAEHVQLKKKNPCAAILRSQPQSPPDESSG